MNEISQIPIRGRRKQITVGEAPGRKKGETVSQLWSLVPSAGAEVGQHRRTGDWLSWREKNLRGAGVMGRLLGECDGEKVSDRPGQRRGMALAGPPPRPWGEARDSPRTPGPTCCQLLKRKLQDPKLPLQKAPLEGKLPGEQPPSASFPKQPWASGTFFYPPGLPAATSSSPPRDALHPLPAPAVYLGRPRQGCPRVPGVLGQGTPSAALKLPPCQAILGSSPELRLSGQVPSCPAQREGA